MNYQEAIKRIGVKPGATQAEIEQRFRALAKKYHPDINKNPEATKKFQYYAEAYGIIKLGPESAQKKLDYRKEYELLKSKLTPGTTDYGELQEAEIELIKNVKSEDEAAKLELARKRIHAEIDFRNIMHAKLSRLKDKSRNRFILTPEQKQQYQIQKMNEEIQFKKGISTVHKKIAKIIRTHNIREDKVHIPYMETINGQKITRYAVLTASILAAIITGKIIYDSKAEAYKPISGLIEKK